MSALRYVVLFHEGFGEPHYDVMFESAAAANLITFRAPSWPPGNGDRWTRLGEHRRAYLDYEGPVSGNRGVVRRITQGPLESVLDQDDVFQCIFDTDVELKLTRDERGWLVVMPN